MALSVAPPHAAPVAYPTRGSARVRALARRLLALIGWRVDGALPPVPKFVIVIAPHTSNWDFPVGLLAKYSLGLRASWLGKHTLFHFPVAGLLRWLGGEPVDRSAPHGLVGEAINRFRARDRWVLAIPPEGTRRRAERWRTGFHRIALGAGVPIVPVAIDYSRKSVTIFPPVAPTPDTDADLARIRALYHAGMARHPEDFAES